MWRTSEGNRVLEGAEKALMKAALRYAYDAVKDDAFFVSVPCFSKLTTREKLSLLRRVNKYLLKPGTKLVKLTNKLEATVGAVFDDIKRRLVDDYHTEIPEARDLRELVLAALRENCCESDYIWDAIDIEGNRILEEKLPRTVDCVGWQLWEDAAEFLLNRILWDRDYELGGMFASLGGDKAGGTGTIMTMMGISGEYYQPPLPPVLPPGYEWLSSMAIGDDTKCSRCRDTGAHRGKSYASNPRKRDSELCYFCLDRMAGCGNAGSLSSDDDVVSDNDDDDDDHDHDHDHDDDDDDDHDHDHHDDDDVSAESDDAGEGAAAAGGSGRSRGRATTSAASGGRGGAGRGASGGRGRGRGRGISDSGVEGDRSEGAVDSGGRSRGRGRGRGSGVEGKGAADRGRGGGGVAGRGRGRGGEDGRSEGPVGRGRGRGRGATGRGRGDKDNGSDEPADGGRGRGRGRGGVASRGRGRGRGGVASRGRGRGGGVEGNSSEDGGRIASARGSGVVAGGRGRGRGRRAVDDASAGVGDRPAQRRRLE